MRALLSIVGKDLRQRFRDRSALLVAFVLPLVLAGIMGALWGSTATPRPFRYAVADLDHAAMSRTFTDDVLPSIAREGVLTLRTATDAADARRLVERGVVDAAFIVPAGFTARIQGQSGVGIDVVGDVDQSTATDVAASIARSYAAELTSVRVALAATGAYDHAGGPPDAAEAARIAAAAQRVAATQRPLVLRDASAAAKILDTKTYLAAGMAVFFLFFTVQFAVASLLDERAQGTLARLRAAPVPAVSVLAGKLLAAILVGLVSMTVLIGATTLLFGASWGNPLGVAVLVVAGVLAATGVTALVASLARTPDQAGGLQSVVSVLLGLLGGAFFPIAQVGGAARAASLLTPHAWFLRGLGDLHGGGVADALPAAAAMGLIAVATLGLSLLRLRKVVQP